MVTNMRWFSNAAHSEKELFFHRLDSLEINFSRSTPRIASLWVFVIRWRRITTFMDGPKKYKSMSRTDLAHTGRGKVAEVVKVEINMNHYLISSHTHPHALTPTPTHTHWHPHPHTHARTDTRTCAYLAVIHLLNRQLPAYWLAHKSSQSTWKRKFLWLIKTLRKEPKISKLKAPNFTTLQ